MDPPTIAIVGAGGMGAAIAHRFTTSGLTVLTILSGRSEATRKRALDAGMQDTSLSDIALRADWVLSILPPKEAVGFALGFRDAYMEVQSGGQEAQMKRGATFVDCNAISPDTAKQIASLFAGTPIGFIDVGIIGWPPTRDGYNPTFYASVDPRDDSLLMELGEMERYGLKVSPLRGEGVGIGDASAVKMMDGGILKGSISLYTTMILAAYNSSPATATALIQELASSQPAILKHLVFAVPDMIPKAYRFVGEMEQVAQYAGEGGGKEMYEGAARVFERVAKSFGARDDSEDGEDVKVLKLSVEEAKKVMEKKTRVP
ncbi:hypothetical protein EIP91_003753 [Steccherinum ochraceum]|uniref:6-phosphogluconate dehydrogenase NADP-binding domain-containing protein n=1 Tax=Steccherinum ochraceum TaxID=92696 RepID=A0A4R0RA12_9APHY|nr:hypothetical protein EIP91_003753 [Steccherinum ochraceum]